MPDQSHRALRVAQVVPEGSAGVTLILDGTLPCEPGQFVMAWLPGVEERPLSVMDDAPLALTIAHIGPFTQALCALRAGDRLWVRGPYGHGFHLRGHRHLLIGGGSGAAGLALLAKCARARGDHVSVVLGARCASLHMLRWRYETLGCDILLASDDGSCGLCGTALDAARPALAMTPDALYACGPEPMLRAVARSARACGVPCWVSLERVMKCGLGVCGSCHCGDQLVCADGPVFPSDVLL
jgi:dihydroorotate dehydrogenase electron transfer subunit